MKKFLSLLSALVFASVGFGAIAVSDTKLSQVSKASPVVWTDIIFAPTANTLIGFDGSKVVGGVTIGSSLSLASSSLNTIQGIRTVDSPAFTGLTVSGLTTTRVPFVTTGGLLTDASTLTFASGTGILSATGFAGAFNGTLGATTPAAVAATTGTFSGNLTAPDFILGTSGPSVKSSLAARAPRQGLVFDGTAVATVSGVPAFGTGDFSIVWRVSANSFASSPVMIGRTTATSKCPLFSIQTSGSVWLSNISAVILNSVGVLTINKTYTLAYTRSGTTGILYIDGKQDQSITDNSDYTQVIDLLGGYNSGNYLSGALALIGIENRSLTAAEVLTLAETGAPQAADYNNASNTAINTSNVASKFAGSGTLSAESATGFTHDWNGAGNAPNIAAQPNRPATEKGKKFGYSFTITVNSGTGPAFRYWQADAGGSTLIRAPMTTGSYSGEFTVVDAEAWFFAFSADSAAAGNYTVADLVIRPLGLLLAPESNAPGNGYQWKDMSGNMADIALPTSGVSWALPDVRPNSVRGSCTWATPAAGHAPVDLVRAGAMLPSNAVVTMIVQKAQGATAGTGCAVSSTEDAGRWSAAAALADATKVIRAVANQLPESDAAADLGIQVDPDDQNYAGTIVTEVFYTPTTSTP